MTSLSPCQWVVYLPASMCWRVVEYAGLPVIDLSKADTYEGRVALAKDVTEAMTTIGFFYIINHGLTQAQVDGDVLCFIVNAHSLLE